MHKKLHVVDDMGETGWTTRRISFEPRTCPEADLLHEPCMHYRHRRTPRTLSKNCRTSRVRWQCDEKCNLPIRFHLHCHSGPEYCAVRGPPGNVGMCDTILSMHKLLPCELCRRPRTARGVINQCHIPGFPETPDSGWRCRLLRRRPSRAGSVRR